jgi:lipopolysaccharide export LptBFGC system permease protein LptF
MVKLLIEIVLAVALVLFVITQIIIPLVSDKWGFFWIFYKNKNVEVPFEQPTTLGDLEKETKTAVKQIKKAKKKIEVVDKQLQEIKSQIN